MSLRMKMPKSFLRMSSSKAGRFTSNYYRNDLQPIIGLHIKYISPAETDNFFVFVCFWKSFFAYRSKTDRHFSIAWHANSTLRSCCLTAKQLEVVSAIVQRGQCRAGCCRSGVSLGRSTPSVCPVPTIYSKSDGSRRNFKFIGDIITMGGASIGAGRVISPPLFYTVGVKGYINSLQLFNNTTCLQSCNVVFPALRHSTAIIIITLAVAMCRIRLHWNWIALRRLRLH